MYLYLTLPNLQVSYIPTYCMQEPPQQRIIHSSIHSLPSSLPVAGLVYMSVCVPVRPCISVYVRVSVRVSVRVHVHTYNTLAYPQKAHIKRYISKDTYQRYMYTCVLGYVVVSYFKNIFADPIDTKNHPTNVRAPALSFTTSLGEFLCASQSKISLSNWRPKTTVCLASYLR